MNTLKNQPILSSLRKNHLWKRRNPLRPEWSNSTLNVRCAVSHAAAFYRGRRRRRPALADGAGWRRGAKTTGLHGRCAALTKSTNSWRAIISAEHGGARFADFINAYRPATRSGRPSDPRREPEDLVGYVSLETEDGGYYVGLDMESALHPQTLLCYEMNGKPLTAPHGAPLRLAIPVKYGIKNIKRIGTIRFTDRRPPDYWAERGYDWYAGH